MEENIYDRLYKAIKELEEKEGKERYYHFDLSNPIHKKMLNLFYEIEGKELEFIRKHVGDINDKSP